MPLHPCVYIVTNQRNGTLYTGVTGDLPERIWRHKQGTADGFFKRYQTTRLVWHEVHETMEEAIIREKQIKKWKRSWKLELIETNNPQWIDLHNTLNS